MTATVERFGAVDILVNNAATNPYYGPIIDLDTGPGRQDGARQPDRLSRVGPGGVARRACPNTVASSSTWPPSVGSRCEAGIGWYNVTKAAVIHLTRQLAGELGPQVRVNGLAPGLVKTEFARALWEPAEESIARRLPLRRLG